MNVGPLISFNRPKLAKKTFYNYFRNKEDFIHQEEDILTNLKSSLRRDQQILTSTHHATAQEIIHLAGSALDETLKYCDKHKDELAVLLSNNGDINLYHAIVNLANEEFVARAPCFFGITPAKMKESFLDRFFQTLYVDEIINLLIFWLNHRDTMSVDNVKYLAGLIQTKSTMQLMKSLAD